MAPAPASPTSRAGWGAVIQFGAYVFLLSLLFSVVVTPWVPLPWWRVFRRCVSVSAVISLMVCAWRRGRAVHSYGLTELAVGGRHLLIGASLGLAACASVVAVGFLSQAYQVEIIPDHVRLWRVIVTFVPLAVLIGVVEELVFRGFILQHLLAHSTKIAVAASSVLYSAVHLKTLTWSVSSGLELAGLALLGAVLAMSYLQTGQLYLAIGLHAALAYGARVGKLTIAFPEAPQAWLFGTSRVINGVVSWGVLMGVGALILLWSRMGRSANGGMHG